MSRNQPDLTNSHYLNEENRIIEETGPDTFQEPDADYNIRTGQTFGESEDITLEKQNWHDA